MSLILAELSRFHILHLQLCDKWLNKIIYLKQWPSGAHWVPNSVPNRILLLMVSYYYNFE